MRKIMKWGGLVGVIMFLMVGAAQAISVNISAANGSITDSGGANTLTSANSLIQFIQAAAGVPNPPNATGGPTGGDILLDVLQINPDGSLGAPIPGFGMTYGGRGNGGFFVYGGFNVSSGTGIYVRVWDAATVGGATHYGDSNINYFSWSGPPPVFNWNINAFRTDINKAAPVIHVSHRDMDLDDAVVSVTVEAGYRVATGHTYIDGNSFRVQYRPVGVGSWTIINSRSLTNISLTLRSLTPTTNYEVQAWAANYFGVTGPVADAFATLPLPPGVTGPLSFILTLESQVPDPTPGPGINNFSMPFAGPWYDSAGTPLVNSYDLVLAINRAAGANIVSTFGRWNKTLQKVVGVTIPGYDPTLVSGPLGAITLSQGEGYQAYVIQDVTLEIKNRP